MFFSLYEADPKKIEEYADTSVKKSIDIGNVDVDALKGKARAAEQVTGGIDDLLDEPFTRAGKDAVQVALASAFAAGVLYRWSAAIATFNVEVDKLNKEYEDRAAVNFGVPEAPAAPSGGLSPGAQDEQHDEDVIDAKGALIRELRERWSRQELALDAAADDADSDLKKGPTEENVLALFATGDLPRAAFPLLAALGIDPKKVMTVIAKLKPLLANGTIGAGPGGDMQRDLALRELLDALHEVDPRAAAVILGTLSAQQQKELGDVLAAGSDRPDVPGIYSFFLSGATSAQVDGLRQLWEVDPDGSGGWDRPGPYSLFPAFPDMSARNSGAFIGARQGSVGDCRMMAKRDRRRRPGLAA